MGTLRIHGTIDIMQFWPFGASDADTTKIELIVGKDSFEYKRDTEKTFLKTNAFEDAISKGQGSKAVINTSKKTGIQTITVRLQGVDAPELHYRAAPLKKSTGVSDSDRKVFNDTNKERRQCFAESSTFALANHLKKYVDGKGLIQAVFETNVDHPFEVVDTYGRFVGNIMVSDGQDINVWLVENGWGLPAFYTSMSTDEIQIFLAAWKKGKSKKGTPSTNVSYDGNKFDWNLEYIRPSSEIQFKIGDDKGKSLMPKIFRRQTSWMVSKKAGVISSKMNFQTYLKGAPDQLILLDDFLKNGVHSSRVLNLHEFITPKNIMNKGADELVFKEKPGTLVNSKGKKIENW
jgi:endonuclease YncB( thermonuclease family)